MPTFTLLSDDELNSIRRSLIESNGDPGVLGEDYLQIMRNVIYTARMKANPMQNTPDSSPKVKTVSVKKETLKGPDIDKFLG